MKKKKWIIPLIVVGIILVTFVAGVGLLISKGYGASTGVYLESKDGAAILIRENTPILMSSNDNGEMFDGLDIGDKIFVIHTGIEESYPARTGAYAVFKINDGVTGAIPLSVIEELTELGWIDSAKDVEFDLPSGESSKN